MSPHSRFSAAARQGVERTDRGCAITDEVQAMWRARCRRSSPDAAPMIDVRSNLIDASKRAGISLVALSRIAGRNAAYAQQFVTRGTPERLPEDVRLCWAQALRIDERLLGAREPWSP